MRCSHSAPRRFVLRWSCQSRSGVEGEVFSCSFEYSTLCRNDRSFKYCRTLTMSAFECCTTSLRPELECAIGSMPQRRTEISPHESRPQRVARHLVARQHSAM